MDAMEAMFAEAQEKLEAHAKENNAHKCVDRIQKYFSRQLVPVPAKGNYTLFTVIARTHMIEAVMSMAALSSGEGLAVAPIRIIKSGHGVRWIACCEAPARYPGDGCIVVTVSIGDKLVRIVPEDQFIKYWGDTDIT